MKKFIVFISLLLLFTGYATSAVAVPVGTWEYQVTEDSSTFLNLHFTNLQGSIQYQLWLETTPVPQGQAWDVYYKSVWQQESGGAILVNFGQIAFNGSDSAWRNENLSNPALFGAGWLRISLGDSGNNSIPVAYLRNFTPAPVPEPATMLLLGFGLLGLAGVRRRFKK